MQNNRVTRLLPGCNASHSMPDPSSHSADGQETASHTWRTQNAVNRKAKKNSFMGSREKVPGHLASSQVVGTRLY